MRKIVIFGNSGSGKSTLAMGLCAAEMIRALKLPTKGFVRITRVKSVQ